MQKDARIEDLKYKRSEAWEHCRNLTSSHNNSQAALGNQLQQQAAINSALVGENEELKAQMRMADARYASLESSALGSLQAAELRARQAEEAYRELESKTTRSMTAAEESMQQSQATISNLSAENGSLLHQLDAAQKALAAQHEEFAAWKQHASTARSEAVQESASESTRMDLVLEGRARNLVPFIEEDDSEDMEMDNSPTGILERRIRSLQNLLHQAQSVAKTHEAAWRREETRASRLETRLQERTQARRGPMHRFSLGRSMFGEGRRQGGSQHERLAPPPTIRAEDSMPDFGSLAITERPAENRHGDGMTAPDLAPAPSTSLPDEAPPSSGSGSGGWYPRMRMDDGNRVMRRLGHRASTSRSARHSATASRIAQAAAATLNRSSSPSPPPSPLGSLAPPAPTGSRLIFTSSPVDMPRVVEEDEMESDADDDE